jgi:hypothetical protein
MKLHYGCGLHAVDDWMNCDASLTLRLQSLPVVGPIARKLIAPEFPAGAEYGNIVSGLRLPPNSCDAIYCCHVLEHLSLVEARRALQNTYSYLKPGATFRMVVPDLEQQVSAYLKDEEPSAASNFLRYTFLGREDRPRGIIGFLRTYLGHSHHLWMWDFESLADELQRIGFKSIRRYEFGDVHAPDFVEVEVKARFEWSLAIECKK